MKKTKQIIEKLEIFTPLNYQENYDNCGLLIGNENEECLGILITLDITMQTIEEAISKKCNLIISHHPIIFNPIKKINNSSIEEQIIYKAIKNSILIYAIHTNLDNIKNGVNHYFAKKLNLINTKILLPKKNILCKLQTYIPTLYVDKISNEIFKIGAGNIGNYSECSFKCLGEGSYKANENSNPFTGNKNIKHTEQEYKIEIIFPKHLTSKVINTLKNNHPYEEVAYDIINLENDNLEIGSGLIGEIEKEKNENEFLTYLKKQMNLQIIKHSAFVNKNIKKIAICGGSGAFLINTAINQNADIFITSDLKYHDYFLAENKIVVCDIGHYESEVATIDLIYDYLIKILPKFVIFKTNIITNPIYNF